MHLVLNWPKQSTSVTYLLPVLAGLSVWVEVEDDAAEGELMSMGCEVTAPLTDEEEDGMDDEAVSGTSASEWELLSLDTPYNT